MLKTVSRLTLGPVARGVFRAKIVGRRNVPKKGPVLLASNHLSFIDSVVITLFAPRPVSFLAKDSYFTGKGFKGFLSRTFFTSIGAIPVKRGAGQAAQDALDAGLSLLHEGEAFRGVSRGHQVARRSPVSRKNWSCVARAQRGCPGDTCGAEGNRQGPADWIKRHSTSQSQYRIWCTY